MYEYRATIIRIVDADTVWLEVDLGFDVKRKDSFRLYGINAPEMSTAEGVNAKMWLTEYLKGGPLVITTEKDRREKYGRYLATLWVGGQNVNQALIEAGHAVPYQGR